MIVPSGAVRVLVATRPVDFRNYAECTIMLSPRRLAEYPRCSAIAYPKQVGSLLGIILGPSAVPWWRRREDRDVEAERRVTTKSPMYGSRRTGDVCGSVHQSAEDPWAHATDRRQATKPRPVTLLSGCADVGSQLLTSMMASPHCLHDIDASVVAPVSIISSPPSTCAGYVGSFASWSNVGVAPPHQLAW